MAATSRVVYRYKELPSNVLKATASTVPPNKGMEPTPLCGEQDCSDFSNQDQPITSIVLSLAARMKRQPLAK